MKKGALMTNLFIIPKFWRTFAAKIHANRLTDEYTDIV